MSVLHKAGDVFYGESRTGQVALLHLAEVHQSSPFSARKEKWEARARVGKGLARVSAPSLTQARRVAMRLLHDGDPSVTLKGLVFRKVPPEEAAVMLATALKQPPAEQPDPLPAEDATDTVEQPDAPTETDAPEDNDSDGEPAAEDSAS